MNNSTSGPITQSYTWQRLGRFLEPNDILLTESGTAQFGMPDSTFPANVRYITQIFFPGEPLNETDLLFNGIRDEEARQRLLFQPLMPVMGKPGEPSLIGYRLDFVLRGKHRTPELD